MKTTKQKYFDYIGESFDCELMEIPETSTPKEKARKFLELVKDRHRNISDYQNTIDHIQGLGEYISIEYMNFDILNRARDYGVIDNMLNNARFSKMKDKEKAIERIEEQITQNYWNIIANYILQISK